VPFTLEWASVYTFACLRMDRFRHGRVVFAGDSAHGVSPFGARGANSGVQDADNLAWKLDAVLRAGRRRRLLDSYADEREHAADENILNSTRATDFITPKSEISRLFRNAVLGLARDFPFARRMVNSGRLSVPATLDGSPLNTADVDLFSGPLRPGAPAGRRAAGPRRPAGLAAARAGAASRCWCSAPRRAGRRTCRCSWTGDRPRRPGLRDVQGLAAQRYDADPAPPTCCAPTAMSAARWRAPTDSGVPQCLGSCVGES
jgi:3-(3-hydroxy-phenyl)propionate hydroxylase